MNLKFQNIHVGILNLSFASNWKFNDKFWWYNNYILQYLRILNQTNGGMPYSK